MFFELSTFKTYFLLSACLLYFNATFSQVNDTIQSTKLPIESKGSNSFPDSIFKFIVKLPSPKRAALYSALLPSLGQIYNKQYWKTGVVYLGVGTITYFLIDNQTNFKSYQKAYIDRLNNPNNQGKYPERSLEDLKYIRDNYARLKEYSVIAAVVGYLVTILDAYTASHLKTFDKTRDMSLKMSPSSFPNQAMNVGLAIKFN
jgi:hypothetical protein